MLVEKKKRPGSRLLFAPTGIVLSNTCVVEPDLFFLLPTHPGARAKRRIHGPPDLAIEVLSPSNRKRDLVQKRDIYARFGVSEYQIVDPEEKTIDVLALSDASYRATRFEIDDVARSTIVLPGLEIALLGLFADEPADD